MATTITATPVKGSGAPRPLPIDVDAAHMDDGSDLSGSTSQIDSGYASASTTPKSEHPGRAQSADLSKEQEHLPPQKLQPSSTAFLGALRRFSGQIDETVMRRFKDVSARLHEAFMPSLKRSRARHREVVMRLMMLGKEESDVKPTIVILCSSKARKDIKKCLDEDWIKAIYQPVEAGQVRFEAVFGPPIVMTAQNWLSDHDLQNLEVWHRCNESSPTWCGSQLLIGSRDGSEHVFTVGGLIQVRKGSERSFYYMLAAHAIQNRLMESPSDSEEDNSDEDETESDSQSQSDQSAPSNDGEAPIQLNSSQHSHIDGADQVATAQIHCETPNCERLGERASGSIALKLVNEHPFWTPASQGSKDQFVNRLLETKMCSTRVSDGIICPADKQSTDWALIKIDVQKASTLKPNRLPPTGEGRPPCFDLVIAKTYETSREERDVTLITSIQGLKKGKLALAAGSMFSVQDSKPVEVFMLTLDDNADIVNGDSGSWVVDSRTNEVYGHLIAKDVFGDGYVVPLKTIFVDIQQCLLAEEVSLPTSIDIHFPLSGPSIVEPALAFSREGRWLSRSEPDSGYSSARVSRNTSDSLARAIASDKHQRVPRGADSGYATAGSSPFSDKALPGPSEVDSGYATAASSPRSSQPNSPSERPAVRLRPDTVVSWSPDFDDALPVKSTITERSRKGKVSRVKKVVAYMRRESEYGN